MGLIDRFCCFYPRETEGFMGFIKLIPVKTIEAVVRRD